MRSKLPDDPTDERIEDVLSSGFIGRSECEICGQPVRREWGYRLAEGGPNNVLGPLLFCSEKHREEYRHHHQ